MLGLVALSVCVFGLDPAFPVIRRGVSNITCAEYRVWALGQQVGFLAWAML